MKHSFFVLVFLLLSVSPAHAQDTSGLVVRVRKAPACRCSSFLTSGEVWNSSYTFTGEAPQGDGDGGSSGTFTLDFIDSSTVRLDGAEGRSIQKLQQKAGEVSFRYAGMRFTLHCAENCLLYGIMINRWGRTVGEWQAETDPNQQGVR